MEKYNDIEKLFKETLQNHESPVNPDLWANISSNLSSAAGSSSAATVAGAAGKISLIKTIVIGISSTAAIVTSGYFIYNALTEETKESAAKEIVEKDGIYDIEQKNVKSEQNEDIPHNTKGLNDQTNQDSGTTTSPNNEVVYKSAADQFGTPARNKNFNKPGYSPTGHQQTDKTQQEPQKNTPAPAESVVSDTSADTELTASPKTVEILISNNSPKAFEKVIVRSSIPTAQNSWLLPDGSIVNSQETEYAFEQYGNNKIVLITTLGNGEELTQTLLVDVKPVSTLGILPNILTPNGDGVNDEYTFDTDYIKEITFTVLNTQGREVFTTKSSNETWKGTDQYGNRLSNGTYMVIIKAVGEDGKLHQKSQAVMLTF